MNTINEYIVEELQERRGNDLNVYKANSDTSLGLSVSNISDFKFNVHQKYLDMIITELNGISPNIDKEILDRVSKYNFDKLSLSIINLNGEHIKSFNFKYLTHYCRLIEKLLNDAIKDKIDEKAMIELLGDSTVYRLEKQTVVGSIRYGKDLDVVKSELEYGKVDVDNDYFNTVVIPFINGFKSKQDGCRKLYSEYSKVVEILQSCVNKLLTIYEENKTNPFNNAKAVHGIIIKSIRILDKVSGFVTFCVLLKIQELVSKVIAVQSLYNDLLNSDYAITEGFDASIIFPTDTHALAEDMLHGHCSAFIELSNHIYSYYTMTNNTGHQLLYIDRMGENEGKPYDNKVYIDIMNAIGIISKGLDRLGKEGEQYLMMFDDVLKETGLNLPLKQQYKNELELLANNVEKELPILDTDNVDRKLWELIDFKKNVEALTNLAHDTYRKIQLLLERFGNNINSEYKDMDTINSYKVFLTDFIGTYTDFIENVCGALITRVNNINDSLEKSTESIQPNYSKPSITDSQLSMESVNYLDIVFEETIKSIEDNFRYNFISLENEYVIAKHYRDTGYRLIIEDSTNNSNGGTSVDTTNSQNNAATVKPTTNTNANKTNQNNTNQNNQQNQQQNGNNQNNQNNTKVQINDGDKQTGGNSKNTNGMIKKIIERILNAFREIAEKLARKNDKWLQNNKAALLNRSYANVTVNILPYHNMPTDKFAADIDKLNTNLNSMTIPTLATLNDENSVYKKLFTFVQGGIDTKNGDLGTLLTNYYKVGNAKMETVQVANGDLKHQIDGTMIPYCEKYSHDFLNNITQKLNTLKENADKHFLTLSTADSDNNQGDKIQWMIQAVGKFCGGMCNAARDRYNDYFKVLYTLVPKNTNQQNNNNDQNNNQNQPVNNNNQNQNNDNNNNGNQG